MGFSRKIISRFTLRQLIFIAVPLLTFSCWGVLLFANHHKLIEEQYRAYIESQTKLIQSYSESHATTIAVQDYTDIARSLNSIVIGEDEKSIAFVNTEDRIIYSDLTKREAFDALWRGWHASHKLADKEMGISFKKDIVAFQYPLTIEPDTFVGSIILFSSNKSFEEKRSAMNKKFVLVGMLLLFIQTVLLLKVSSIIIKPIEQFINQWKIKEKELLPDALLELSYAPKDIMTLNRSIAMIMARQSTVAAIGKMVAQIAHDLKSPISAILKFISHKKSINSDTDPDEVEYFDVAERSATKLKNMVEEMLDYARATNLTKETFGLSALLNEIRQDVLNGIEGKDVNISCDCPEGLKINADRTKLNRVITNLVVNAVQAIEDKGRIGISVRMGEHAVAISVHDTGKGILPEHLPKLFDSTFTFGKAKGTGIGLNYCKQIVDAHGGSIGVESAQGKGSTFTITIP